MPSVIFSGTKVKALKNILNLNDQAEVISGDSDDPTVVAKDAPAGSLYIQTNGDLYRKTDAGSSTNWVNIGNPGGGYTYRTENSNVTAVLNDFIFMDASGGGRTVTLPTAVGNAGARIVVKKSDVSTNAVGVDGDAAETVDGLTTLFLDSELEAVTVVSDGTNWLVKDRTTPAAKFRAVNSSAQLIPNSTVTQVTSWTVVHDTLSQWSGGASEYNVPYTGYYNVEMSLVYNSTFSNGVIGQSIFQRDATQLMLGSDHHDATNNAHSCMVACSTFYFEKNMKLTVRTFQNSGASANISGDLKFNYFSITKV